MCGIAGIHVKKSYVGRFPIGRMMDYLLLGNEWRGKDATGYLALHGDGQLKLEKCDVPAREFVQLRDPVPHAMRTVLLHTRAWTKGSPTKQENNHPVQHGSCYAVHNGHINNDDRIFAEYDLKRKGEVDSEAIPASLFYHGWGDDDIVQGLESLTGAFCIAAVDPDQAPGKLLIAKGPNNPLYVLNTRKALLWSSTLKAIEEAWGQTFGTPPTKKADFSKDEWFGVYDMKYGQFLMIDDEDNMELRKFSPGKQAPGGSQFTSTFRGGSTGSSGSSAGTSSRSAAAHHAGLYGDCGDPDCNACTYGYPAYCDNERVANTEDACGGNRCLGCPDQACFAKFWIKDPMDGYVRRSSSHEQHKIWTCSPSHVTCEHPCVEGCMSGKCVCYLGSDRHPKWKAHVLPAGSVGGLPDVPDNGTARNLSLVRYTHPDGVSGEISIDTASGKVIEGTITEVECDGCFSMYPPQETISLDNMQGGTYIYCMNCNKLATEMRVKAKIKTAEDFAHEINHMRALHEVAFELDTTPKFVQWLIFECPKENYEGEENEWLAKTRSDLAAEYDNAIAIAERIANGEYRR